MNKFLMYNHHNRQIFFYIYCLIILFCFTFSQKIINTAQHWPFLYPGLFLVSVHIFLLSAIILYRLKIQKYGIDAVVLLFLLMFYMLLNCISHDRALKNFVITTLTGPAFVLSLSTYYNRRASVAEITHNLCKILVFFSVIESVVAWLFLFGSAFRLEVMNTPTNFSGGQDYTVLRENQHI